MLLGVILGFMKTRRPALRYFGGKWRLAPWIISFFPEHRVYVEPFAGGASVLLRKPRSKIEIYNDLDEEIVNVFRVLRDETLSESLRRKIILTPFSRSEYLSAFESHSDPVERARRTIIKSFMGHGSDSVHMNHKSGFRSKTSNPNTHRCAALDWVNYPPEIPLLCNRLRGVTIENKDALEIIKAFDGPDTLFYVDPPYVHETRQDRHNYRHELNDEAHGELLKVLNGIRGMALLSGYENPIYAGLGWEKEEIKALADGARERTECLWLNPAARDAGGQMELEHA